MLLPIHSRPGKGKLPWRPRVITILLALLLCCGALAGCSGNAPEDEWAEETPDQTAGYRRTVLYYQSDDGMMVPVMKLLPWEEGIGKAALNQLVDTEENRLSSTVMGLKNVVPQGVSFVLSISDDAVATLNICNLPDLGSVEAEAAMVTAVVNTLTEFPSIEQVQLEFDGKAKKSLPHGTAVNGVMSALPLNEEPLPVNASSADLQRMILYFPNRSASLNVPVTRYLTGEPTFAAAMEGLVAGPVDDSLRGCFPEGTQVLSATILDDAATVNFSKEFASISDTPELEAVALETMQLTAKQFGSIANVVVQVDGKEYQAASSETMAMPLYANEFRTDGE